MQQFTKKLMNYHFFRLYLTLVMVEVFFFFSKLYGLTCIMCVMWYNCFSSLRCRASLRRTTLPWWCRRKRCTRASPLSRRSSCAPSCLGVCWFHHFDFCFSTQSQCRTQFLFLCHFIVFTYIFPVLTCSRTL